MKVTITGVTGLVGRELTRSLTADGHHVVGLSRSPERARASMPGLADAHGWSPTAEPAPTAAFTDTEAVVNLMGDTVVGRWTAAKKQAIHDSRVIGTRRLVDTLVKLPQKPRVLVSASAIGYYGDRGAVPLDESSPPGSDFLADVCRDWEVEAMRAISAGIRVVTLRIGLVLASDGGALGNMLTPFKLGLGGNLGSGAQWWSWIHRRDLVRTIRFAIDHDVEGALNATAPEPVTQEAFADELGRQLGRPTFMPAPAFILRAVLGGFAHELLSSKRVLPSRLLESGFEFEAGSLDTALRMELEG